MNNQHPEKLQLMALFDGELLGDESDKVQNHLNNCSECRQEIAGFGHVQNLIQDDLCPEIPQSVWPQVKSQMIKDRKQQFTPSFVFGTAAACAAGIVMGILMGAPADSGNINQVESAWSDTSYLWSESDSPTLFNVFSDNTNEERSSES